MSKSVQFCFDFGSPTAYLAWTQIPKIAKRTGAEIIWTPILLGGIFKATGNQPPGSVPAKGNYMGGDLMRFAKRYQVPLAMNPHFPVNTLPLMRGATALLNDGNFHNYLSVVFEAMWIKPQNLNEPAEIAAVWQKAGLQPQAFMEKISQPENKQALISATENAVKRGAFGAPTFFVGDAMFFGQDRMDFVEEALKEA